MKYNLTNKKRIAAALLTIMVTNILTPAVSYALTSGPVQPETKGFQPAGVSDMVDIQTGDFKYNIPLLDIDGYPINLNYQANAGMDDEASWVGLGWSLTPGAINRQVRGLPDDFSGDLNDTYQVMKPKITVGGKLTAKAEIFGRNTSGSISVGLFSDNYTGIGGEVGMNAGISFSRSSDSFLTAGLGVGVLSNTQTGVDATPYVSLGVKRKADASMTINAGLSAQLGYNTRSGMKSLTLGSSFGGSNNDKDNGVPHDDQVNIGEQSLTSTSSSISYNTPAISPAIQVPYSSTYNSFSFDIGPTAMGGFVSVGGTGYRNTRTIKGYQFSKPAYGFLYAERGKNNPNALMDFIREKDNPVIPALPNIAIPIHTPDVWSYSSQGGGGQFRLYRGGTGAFFDNASSDESKVGTFGGDVGIGAYAHGGLTAFNQTTHNDTRKWTENNAYLKNGDFQDLATNNPNLQHVFFKQVGEKGLEDYDQANNVLTTNPLSIVIDQTRAFSTFRVNNSSLVNAVQNIKRSRQPNKTVISYLTANEAKNAALEKMIRIYPVNDSASFHVPANNRPVAADSVERTAGDRKSHHISEITVTDDGGKRMVYGVPVYNLTQDEYTFAVGRNYTAVNGNQVATPAGIATPQADNHLGLDNYYQRDHKAAYATSFLLTAVLSPDYMDKTGNGISDDDLGTAIKFNYAKLAAAFKWRTPYQNATLNKCLLADPDDDKGSIITGEKELWYISSIESKTKVAYFITQDRRDALGITAWLNGGPDATQKQKLLKEIRLYSKSDMTRPIKVVKFQYDYELCRGIPNSADLGTGDATKGGKLTLKRVWFEYGNTNKGKYHPYIFDYNRTTAVSRTTSSIDSIVKYNYLSTDRWGTYKNNNENSAGLNNETYPYTNQIKATIDDNAALWHLKKIVLPTGGNINVTYESHDYAHVQDKKAMTMSPIQSLLTSPTATVDSNHLQKAKGLSVTIGTTITPPSGADQTKWFKDNFLNGSDYLYTKMYIKLATGVSNSYGRDYDYVPVYSKISYVTIASGVAKIMLADMNESGVSVNPISLAAWQRLKNEYPRYAYPGFDNRVNSDNSNLLGAVSAIVQAVKNLSELSQNFYQKSNKKGYASEVALSKSFVKIAKIDGHKFGGGARVKRIAITDQWQQMLNDTTNPVAGQYGQVYDYTAVENGITVSTGVATYEPAVGNDENALKDPVIYGQNVKGGINNYFSLEKPFCESLYPSPSIGYRKVTVNDLGSDHLTASNKTGSIINEFYTAKDYPVKVTVTPIDSKPYRPSSYFSLTKTTSEDDLTLSQGYVIALNDMHGKPKSVRVLNQTGAEISSTVYYYRQNDQNQLDNHVDIINNQGVLVPNQVLGRDIEFFTDFREQSTTNQGHAYNFGFDVFPAFLGIPLFIPHKPFGENNENKKFRSACALKVIQTYGMIDRVVKTQNGSSITTQNIAFDGLTGEPLVTKTQNEFGKDIYSVNMPAYWVYKGMGGAYQNLGVYLSAFTTNSHGELASGYSSYLQAGDEVLDVNGGSRYWVIDNTAYSGGGTTKKLIDRSGNLKRSFTPYLNGLVKIVRSGFRNMVGASTSSIVCLANPLVTAAGVTKLAIATNGDKSVLKVINASATTFDENWAVSNGDLPYDFDPDYDNIKTNNSDDLKLVHFTGDTAHYTQSIHTLGLEVDTIITTLHGSYWKNILSSSIKAKTNGYLWTSIDAPVNVDKSKYIILGLGSNRSIRVQASQCDDGVVYGGGFSIGGGNGSPYNLWKIYLTKGVKTIHITLGDLYGPNYDAYGRVDIFDNTVEELAAAGVSGSGLNRLFTTEGLEANDHVRTGRSNSETGTYIYHYTFTDGSPIDACTFNNYNVLNPFIQGNLGNWRLYQTKVFQQNRNYVDPFNSSQKLLDIKNAGYINKFSPHWYYNSTAWVLNTDSNSTRWTTANTVTLYDKFSQQLENRDALNRYSAAKFDFNGELPSAVASNARNREIYVNSLEDAVFAPGNVSTGLSKFRDFVQTTSNKPIKALYDTTYSHSGNYSMKLPSDGITLKTIVHDGEHKSTSYLNLDTAKQYITKADTGLYPNGFEPSPNKKYVFTAWVRDGDRYNKYVHLTLKVNNSNVPLTCKAIIENWKLMEGTFYTGSSGEQKIELIPFSGWPTNLDDIRIHPFDAHMKTYAYDDKTMRLMAELDENAFATFYEYDDEGLLIRVKKETDRGIMTIKESRSSYIKNTKN